jgi:hypothetical protein
MLLGLLDGRRPGLGEAVGEEARLIVGLVLELLAEEVCVCTACTSCTVNWRGGNSGSRLRGDDGALAWRRERRAYRFQLFLCMQQMKNYVGFFVCYVQARQY